MRSPDDVFEDIESDRAQREAEIRLIENFIVKTTDENERNMLRRSLVLLTYAHLEGFCKFALLGYAGAVNSLKMPCSEATAPLVAVTLNRVFAALRDVNSKHPYFSAKLPDDRDVHQSARERVFIEEFETIISQHVEIPDRVIDTKSNLNAIVLKRNLYQLGLEYPIIDKHGRTIDKLLGVRNAIAHGDALKVPKQTDVQDYIDATFDVMKFVQNEVYSALQRKAYQKRPERDLDVVRSSSKISQRVTNALAALFVR